MAQLICEDELNRMGKKYALLIYLNHYGDSYPAF
jgi:hypothetical protein